MDKLQKYAGERSQTQKNTYCMIPFIPRAQERQICRQKVNHGCLRAGAGNEDLNWHD